MDIQQILNVNLIKNIYSLPLAYVYISDEDMAAMNKFVQEKGRLRRGDLMEHFMKLRSHKFQVQG